MHQWGTGQGLFTSHYTLPTTSKLSASLGTCLFHSNSQFSYSFLKNILNKKADLIRLRVKGRAGVEGQAKGDGE